MPTKFKMFCAKLLYKFVMFFLGSDRIVVTRGGIRYDLDLSEGIDLSLFLFGSFQSHVSSNSLIKPKNSCIILDVGANIGCMSLALAKRFPNAYIISFEPTDYALNKFKVNLGLNPELANRIEPVQMFVSDQANLDSELKAYASWPVNDGNPLLKSHPVHCGVVMASDSVPVTTLDCFVVERKLLNVGLIKIDTDGHEKMVLDGARQLIASERPFIVFEVGKYVMSEEGITFDWYLDFFAEYRYRLCNAANDRVIDVSNWQKIIPLSGTIDVLAIPL